MVGKPAKRLDGQGPLLQVIRVEGHVEQGGAMQSYLVKLLVAATISACTSTTLTTKLLRRVKK